MNEYYKEQERYYLDAYRQIQKRAVFGLPDPDNKKAVAAIVDYVMGGEEDSMRVPARPQKTDRLMDDKVKAAFNLLSQYGQVTFKDSESGKEYDSTWDSIEDYQTEQHLTAAQKQTASRDRLKNRLERAGVTQADIRDILANL